MTHDLGPPRKIEYTAHITANWESKRESEIEATADIEMDALVAKLTDTAAAEWERTSNRNVEASLSKTSVFWGYNAYRIYQTEDGTIEIDFRSPLVLDTRLRRIARR